MSDKKPSKKPVGKQRKETKTNQQASDNMWKLAKPFRKPGNDSTLQWTREGNPSIESG